MGGRGRGTAFAVWRAVCLEGISATIFTIFLLLLASLERGREREKDREGERERERDRERGKEREGDIKREILLKSVTIAAAQFSEHCPLAFFSRDCVGARQ